MRRKMYATAMTAMLVTGTLMGLAVPAAERDGVTLHGDSTYDSIEKITDEDLTLKIMLAIRDGDTIKAPGRTCSCSGFGSIDRRQHRNGK